MSVEEVRFDKLSKEAQQKWIDDAAQSAPEEPSESVETGTVEKSTEVEEQENKWTNVGLVHAIIAESKTLD